MPIAELFLSSVVDTLLNQLASGALAEYARINGISDLLNNWRETLQMICAVMDSAEERQLQGDPAVDEWLGKLREVAYDMEDLLHVFAVDAKKEVESKPKCGWTELLSKMDPRTLLSDRSMAAEIEAIDNRLDKIFRLKGLLGLAENSRARSSTRPSQPRFTTTSLQEPKFFGRKEELEKILIRLTISHSAEDVSVSPYHVVSIVGMGGLGKTTLSQELYNHESVREAFELRAWTCVSDAFDVVAITKSIVQSIAPSLTCDGKDLNWLQNSLKEQLSGKKFLIVLDDVWNENYSELQSLLKPFHSGKRGSRILLTTRNRRVAELVGDRDPTLLNFLSPKDCLSLLAYHAIGKESFESEPRLKEIAEKLAEKCKGLPLAVKTIGGLLRFESDDEKWEDVLHHGIWKREGEQNEIPLALELSYIHLPIHLKRCFAACALYPKDYMFNGNELIRLWNVQGLLHKKTRKTCWDVGMEYLHQLEARSLFQKASPIKPAYSMHDLINDLAKSVVGVTYYSSDEYPRPSNGESYEKVRHAAFTTRRDERCLPSKGDVYHSMKKLRTFMPFQRNFSGGVFISNKVIRDLIMGLKYLRVLSLRHFCISEVPNEIGDLKLLRSIDFSYTRVELLPESICDLVDLEYLLLRRCEQLKKLPRDIQKLTKLLHLDIIDTYKLEEMPPRIGELTNLEVLSSFVVGKEAGQGLKELGPLKSLREELYICNLVEVADVEDARDANLRAKDGISDLSFDWGTSRDDGHQLELLYHLQPPNKIECLRISGYGGKTFPSWVGSASTCMNNVVRIALSNCKSVPLLPPFGRLPLLKILSIEGLDAVSDIGAEFYGTQNPFRSLTSLSFRDMPAWELWSSRGDYKNEQPFPCLRELQMERCPVLKKGLPGRLDSLDQLEIHECPLLETSGDTLGLPSLRGICFSGSNGGLLKRLVDVTSMTNMSIRRVPQLVHFDQTFSTSWDSLESIRIDGCPRLKSLVDGHFGKQVPPMLNNLDMSNCEELEKLPDDLYRLPSLSKMTLANCPKLSSFPSSGLPPTLSELRLEYCPRLPLYPFLCMRLPEANKELTLSGLEGQTSVTDQIVDSRGSQSLQHLSSLSVLRVSNCLASELDCLPALPNNLSRFELQNFKMKSLPHNMQDLTSLKGLEISFCDSITCFPALPRNLSKFKLLLCPKLESLPHDMQDLTSLKELVVVGCDSVTCLPRGGFPPNLECLHLCNCHKLNQPLEEWGLSRLTALRELFIGGEMECMDEIECFPSSVYDGDAWRRALPSSLTKLYIYGMRNAERLAGGLRTHLSSLVELRFNFCEKMRYLPDEGLPDSLEVIDVEGCELLKERCTEPNGEHWPLLQLIPRVILADKNDILENIYRINFEFWISRRLRGSNPTSSSPKRSSSMPPSPSRQVRPRH